MNKWRPEALSHRELVELDHNHVWHPFTQMQQWMAEDPVVIVAAEGHTLIDAEGNRYLDAISSLWCNLLGHRRPEIDDAIKRQLDLVAHTTLLGSANAPSIVLAARLAEIAPPGLTRVFYSDSGSEAVEIALKMAFQYHRQSGHPERVRYLALSNAYHGDTIGSVSIGGMALFHGIFSPLLFEVERARAPYCLRCPWGQRRESCALECTESVVAQIRACGERLAAVVVEPMVQGAAGMILQPPGYLSAIREATREVGALLIVDEVATGFGRTGKLFACEHEAIAPDLMCVAKGLSGGYLPLAATLATEEIFQAFLGPPEAARTFFHGHTFTGNQLACSAALATLELLLDQRLIDGVGVRIARLQAALAPLCELAAVAEVRQIGLMVGIEIVADRQTLAPYAPTARVGARIVRAARNRGVWLRPLGDTIVVFLPLTIELEDIDRIGSVLRDSIAEVVGEEASGDRH